MARMIQRVFKRIVLGFCAGCSFLLVYLLALDGVGNEDAILFCAEKYGLQLAGAAACGLACFLPSLLYGRRRCISVPLCMLIHLGCVAAVTLPVATALCWVPHSPAGILLLTAGEICVFFVCLCVYLWGVREAAQMNVRVRQLQERPKQ